jgi:hypothetical protein
MPPKPLHINIPQTDPHKQFQQAFAIIAKEDLSNQANFVDHEAARNLVGIKKDSDAANTLNNIKQSGRKRRKRRTQRRAKRTQRRAQRSTQRRSKRRV